MSIVRSFPIIVIIIVQLRAQIKRFNTSHCQNGKCFSHVLKRSAPRKKPNRRLKLTQSQLKIRFLAETFRLDNKVTK